MLPTFGIVAIGLFSTALIVIIGLCIKYRNDVRKKYKKLDSRGD